MPLVDRLSEWPWGWHWLQFWFLLQGSLRLLCLLCALQDRGLCQWGQIWVSVINHALLLWPLVGGASQSKGRNRCFRGGQCGARSGSRRRDRCFWDGHPLGAGAGDKDTSGMAAGPGPGAGGGMGASGMAARGAGVRGGTETWGAMPGEAGEEEFGALDKSIRAGSIWKSSAVIFQDARSLVRSLSSFKSFLWLSRDLKVNLFGLQQDT